MTRRLAARGRGRRWRWLVAGLVLLGLLWVLRVPLLRGYGRLLVVDSATPGADAVVVLAGDPFTRIPHALELVDRGIAPRLLVTSPKSRNRKYEKLQASEESIARWILRLEKRTTPLAAVPSLGEGATSTLDEAWDLRAWAEAEGLSRIVAVTGACSSRRAALALAKAFDGSPVVAQVSPAPNEIFDASNWWLSDKGIECHVLEPIKIAVYLLFDRNAPGIRND